MIIGISGKKQHGKDTVATIIQYLTSEYEQHGQTVKSYNSFVMDIGMTEGDYNRHYTWKRKRFADKLKQVVCLLIGCTMEQLENNTFKETPLGPQWRIKYLYRERAYITLDEGNLYPHIPFEQLTPRKLLQLMGTECGREIIHPNIWVNALMSEYKRGDVVMGVTIDTTDNTISGNVERNSFPYWIITDVRFPNEAEVIKNNGGLLIRVDRIIPREALPEYFDVHPSETALDNYDGFDYTIKNAGTIDDLVDAVRVILKEQKIIDHG